MTQGEQPIRSGALESAVVGALFLLLFLLTQEWEFLVALPVAFLAYLVIESRIGGDASLEFMTPTLRGMALTVVTWTVGSAIFYSDRGFWGTFNIVIGSAAAIAAFEFYLRLQIKQSVARANGTAGTMAFGERTLRHLLGYVVGLAFGLLCANFIEFGSPPFLWNVFLVAFLAGKAAVDFWLPQPLRPLPARLSDALKEMALVSPLYWGLPWATLGLLYWIVALGPRYFEEGVAAFFYLFGATVAVFAAITVVAMIREALDRRRVRS